MDAKELAVVSWIQCQEIWNIIASQLGKKIISKLKEFVVFALTKLKLEEKQ